MNPAMRFGDLGGLASIRGALTRSISAENPTGEAGAGGQSTDGAAMRCAKHLGQGWKVSPFFVIEPGVEFNLADIRGPGRIESIWFGGNVSRNYILRFYWEDAACPAVACPLPEFFAYGWQEDRENPMAGLFHPLNSQAVAVNPNRGFNCFWPMPFRSRCRITVENRTEKPYVCYYQINYSLGETSGDEGYFHAQYRQSFPVERGVHTVLDGVAGQGQYVGTALFVGLNGPGKWWGEGEFKFFLDEDRDFPTVCGTGTEDYFGGSYDWEVDGRYTPYSTPYLGMYQVVQSDQLYEHQQRFSMYRWHIPDPVRFSRAIRVTVQDLGWAVPGERYFVRRDDIASVAYWYQNSPEGVECRLPDRDAMLI